MPRPPPFPTLACAPPRLFPPPLQDLPAAASDISHFRGKAALPTHVLGVSSFSKAFFLQPGSEQLYGRVLLGKGPLGDLLYPLYFKATVGPCVVPSEPAATAGAGWGAGVGLSAAHTRGCSALLASILPQTMSRHITTAGGWCVALGSVHSLLPHLYRCFACTVPAATQELCDMRLDYLPPQQLGLARDDLPRSMWPTPRPHLPPFHEGFTDYLRAVAPGVYVG